VWVFPKGKDIANVGIGISGIGYEKTAKQYLDNFILSKPELNKGSIIEVKGGCIPVGGFLDNMVSNGLVGVGDAVNQVNPIHGGGIAESIKAGRIAADVIAKVVKKNDVSAKALSEYNKIWWKECGERLKKVEKIREMFEKMSDDEMNDLAEVLSGQDLVDLTHGKNYTKLAKLYMKYKAKRIRRKFGF
jgi:digeranylgeranylglycerophospholipid reductase